MNAQRKLTGGLLVGLLIACNGPVAVAATSAPPPPPPDTTVIGTMTDDHGDLTAAQDGGGDGGTSDSQAASSKPPTKLYERLNLSFCFVGTKRAETGGAISKFCDVVPEEFFGQECADDEVVMQPLFVRTWGKQPDGTMGWGDLEYAASKRCVGAADPG